MTAHSHAAARVCTKTLPNICSWIVTPAVVLAACTSVTPCHAALTSSNPLCRLRGHDRCRCHQEQAEKQANNLPPRGHTFRRGHRHPWQAGAGIDITGSGVLVNLGANNSKICAVQSSTSAGPSACRRGSRPSACRLVPSNCRSVCAKNAVVSRASHAHVLLVVCRAHKHAQHSQSDYRRKHEHAQLSQA